jgi:hypothetical protein
VARQRRRARAQRHIERRLPSWARSPSAIDLLAARRDLSTREPAKEIPSAAAPTHSPIRVARCASERRLRAYTPARRVLRIALKDRRTAFLPYPAQKAEFSDHGTKDKNRPTTAAIRDTYSPCRRESRGSTRCEPQSTNQRQREAEGRYFPAVLASASLQPSLRSAACDFMHDAIAPLPGLSPQNFVASALQALRTAAVRMIAT